MLDDDPAADRTDPTAAGTIPAATLPPGRDPANSPAPAAGSSGDEPVLPDVTSDERDVGWGDPYEPDDDERFLRDVPPHHGS